MKYHKLSNGKKNAKYTSTLPLYLAICLGAFVRLIHVLKVDFPLNDGGLFYTMTIELIEAGYSLPVYTSYNLANIPYAYPPLPFYVTAILANITNFSVIDLFRFLPTVVNILSIPAFYMFSRRVLRSNNQVVFSVFAFALLPRTFEWLIMGGGITRAFGYLFAILALHQIYLLYTHPHPKFILASTLFSSLTLLCHPETGWFVAFSAGIFFLFYGRNRTGVYYSLIVAVGVLIFTAPWWISIINHHGISPLIAASQSGWHSWLIWLPLLVFQITSEPFVDLLAVLGIIGIFASLAKKHFFLPFWFAAIFIVSPRSAKTLAMIPFAMLIGFGIDQVIMPGIKNLTNGRYLPAIHITRSDDFESMSVISDRKKSNRIPKYLLLYFVLYALFSATMAPLKELSPLEILTTEDRSAMEWVSDNTPPSSVFVVITGDDNVWQDEVTEWFPTITKRVSAATVQGYEWLPGQMELRQKQYKDLQECATQSLNCIEKWVDDYQPTVTNIYLHKVKDNFGNSIDCCCPLRNAIESSPDYHLIFDGPGATIFTRQDN